MGHYGKYLKLGRTGQQPTIIYTVDADGNPILDERKIIIIYVSDKKNPRAALLLEIDSLNDFQCLRYEIMQNNPEKYSKLKKLVDRKIATLEGLEERVGRVD